MSGAVIDVTKRTRIRALAARMHRSGIAGVFSVAGGVPSVDESALADDQRLAATKILEELDAGVIDVADVETASQVAAMIQRYVKPSCSACHGAGIARRSGVDDICVCVDRRWQAAINHQAIVDGLRGSGRAFGASVEGTRSVDAEGRIAEASEVLARARAAATTACHDLDVRIGTLEVAGTTYFAERGRLDADRTALRAQAEDRERAAARSAALAEEARGRTEKVALEVGHKIEPLLLSRPPESPAGDRAQAHEFVDAVYDAASEVARHRADQDGAEDEARHARVAAQSCERQIAALDADNAALAGEVERLRAERARIARHHQPKIDRAEKRLRRLVYQAGGRLDENSAPVDTQEKESD